MAMYTPGIGCLPPKARSCLSAAAITAGRFLRGGYDKNLNPKEEEPVGR